MLCPLHHQQHFYPRSPCGERQRLGLLGWLRVLISIHALLAESDTLKEVFIYVSHISIHALLAESDPWDLTGGLSCDISIHALLAESDRVLDGSKSSIEISIHALLAESDT